jgi:hypothetical protein
VEKVLGSIPSYSISLLLVLAARNLFPPLLIAMVTKLFAIEISRLEKCGKETERHGPHKRGSPTDLARTDQASVAEAVR